MKTSLFNQKGETVGEIELPDTLFHIQGQLDVVHQVVVALESQSRASIAHTKTRGEVRGGGRKPWRQKGTGRARHGSIRSPLWVGGGITFGPRSTRNFAKRIGKKMKRRALQLVLSDKAANEKIRVLDQLQLPEIKTSVVATMLRALGFGTSSIMIAGAGDMSNVIKSSRNIPGIITVRADQLSVLDLLKHEYLLVTKDGLDMMVAHYTN